MKNQFNTKKWLWCYLFAPLAYHVGCGVPAETQSRLHAASFATFLIKDLEADPLKSTLEMLGPKDA
jgi:hypothetical protein